MNTDIQHLKTVIEFLDKDSEQRKALERILTTLTPVAGKEPIAWDFVVAHYPDYDHADEIAWEGDLHKLVTEEYEADDCADKLLKEEYDNDIRNPQIAIDHAEALKDIYEQAIENYLRKGGQ